MKLLVLGANGMFGSTIFNQLSSFDAYKVLGTVRTSTTNKDNIAVKIDILDESAPLRLVNDFKPNVVINCTELIKQRLEATDALQIFPINSLFPHRLAQICAEFDARLIQYRLHILRQRRKIVVCEELPSSGID